MAGSSRCSPRSTSSTVVSASSDAPFVTVLSITSLVGRRPPRRRPDRKKPHEIHPAGVMSEPLRPTGRPAASAPRHGPTGDGTPMADKVIGLDVGTSAVRAVSLSRGTPTHLDLFGQVDLPPGVVAEGEVLDPGAVAHALRQLWKDMGLKGRSVRLAIASPRVIVRTVDMPVLSDADTRAALQLQLGDYIPMAPEATVFDFQPLDGPARPEVDERQLLLAAAPRDA